MLNLDWENENDYKFTEKLNAHGWAWEFLKRNINYQQDYKHWKKDGDECLRGKVKYLDEQEGNIWKKYKIHFGEDKVVPEENNGYINFYKPIQYLYKKYNIESIFFLSNPSAIISDLPDPNVKIESNIIRINFVDEIRISSLFYLEEIPESFIKGLKPREAKEIALLFNLELPIADQLKEAREILRHRKELLEKEGKINCINKRANKKIYQLYLRIFDAKKKKVENDLIAKYFFPTISNIYPEYNRNRKVKDHLIAAKKLIEHDYKYLPLILKNKHI